MTARNAEIVKVLELGGAVQLRLEGDVLYARMGDGRPLHPGVARYIDRFRPEITAHLREGAIDRQSDHRAKEEVRRNAERFGRGERS
jgi:hypothetical protein